MMNTKDFLETEWGDIQMLRNKDGELIFASILSNTDSAISRDKNTFIKWEDGVITTNNCIYEFLSNNDTDADYISRIKVYKFVCWLNSLGYYRQKPDWHESFEEMFDWNNRL